MKTILDLHNIYYSYHTSHGETRALSNLSFSLAPGEFAAVVGSVRLRQIYSALTDLRTDETTDGRNSFKW